MIRCIIIDDEQHAIEVTRNFCHKIPYLEILGTFTAPTEAAAFINLNMSSIDLVFLDIEMPQFSGINFLKAYSFPNVIMVTGYADFALDSYQYGVIDYLLKPFSFDRFSSAIAKVYDKRQKAQSVNGNLLEQHSDALYIKTERNKYVKIAYTDIKYIQGAANYSIIHTNSSMEIMVASKRLKDFEEQLPKGRFQRIHKSHLINMDYFESLQGSSITLRTTDKKLIVGASYRKDFLDFINNH